MSGQPAGKLDWESIQAAIRGMGGARSAAGQTVGAREGRESPAALEGMDQGQMALVDRAAQGALARDSLGPLALLGVPAAAAYEGAKAVEQSPFSNWMTRLMLTLSGGELNESTSPASWDNVAAYTRGVAADPSSFEPPAQAAEQRAPLPPMQQPNVPPEAVAFLKSRGRQ